MLEPSGLTASAAVVLCLVLAYALPVGLVALDYHCYKRRRQMYDAAKAKAAADAEKWYPGYFNPMWFFRAYPVIVLALTSIVIGLAVVERLPGDTPLTLTVVQGQDTGAVQVCSIAKSAEASPAQAKPSLPGGVAAVTWAPVVRTISVLVFVLLLIGVGISAVAKVVREG